MLLLYYKHTQQQTNTISTPKLSVSCHTSYQIYSQHKNFEYRTNTTPESSGAVGCLPHGKSGLHCLAYTRRMTAGYTTQPSLGNTNTWRQWTFKKALVNPPLWTVLATVRIARHVIPKQIPDNHPSTVHEHSNWRHLFLVEMSNIPPFEDYILLGPSLECLLHSRPSYYQYQ